MNFFKENPRKRSLGKKKSRDGGRELRESSVIDAGGGGGRVVTATITIHS